MSDDAIKMPVDVSCILHLLPHRYPFLLVDRVIELEPNRRVRAIKNVTFNEPFFQGHFPDRPVMPGVLIIEAMAQAGGILAYKSSRSNKKNSIPYLAAIDHARFRRVVEPGDQLRIEVKVLRAKRDICKLESFAYVGEE